MTNYEWCCQSIENMAQVIDIAKCGWTREQIIKWLQKEERNQVCECCSGDERLKDNEN